MRAAHAVQPHPLLCGAQGLLIDFDGPICRVFAGTPAAEVAADLRRVAYGLGVPATDALDDVDDPLAVLRHVTRSHPDLTTALDDFLTTAEAHAISSAEPTPGAQELLHEAATAGLRTAIVSNNSDTAIRRYLDRHDLRTVVSSVHGRPQDPARMKPEPDTLHDATRTLRLPARTCVFVGDSETDIAAGHAANIATIAYVNRPAKTAMLAAAGPTALVTDLADLTRSLHC